MVSKENSLRARTATHVFVHEAHNAFFVTAIGSGIEWTLDDYERCRQILTQTLETIRQFPEDGDIPKAEIIKLITKVTKKPWTPKNINKIKADTYSLISKYNA